MGAARVGLRAALEAIAKIARGHTVFLPGGAAEPLALREAWREAPSLAADLTITGLFLPGINAFDYSTLHPTTRMAIYLLTPDFAPAVREGRARFLPLHYSDAYSALARRAHAAIVAHVSPPGLDGLCSLGLAADSTPAVLDQEGCLKVALVNTAMPDVAGAPRVGLSAFDLCVEGEWPLAQASPLASTKGAEAIAKRVADLVEDGDTIQIGIGRLPSAILSALTHRRRLKIHSGLIGEAHLALLDAGAVADEPGALTAGVVIGGQRLYDRLAQDPRLRLAPIPLTHGAAALARIARFKAINAVLEADLFGQLNAEFAGAEAIASVGGLVDFIRGARLSAEGRAIVALSAEGRDGASRIRSRLVGPITVSRSDAPTLVTEYGLADLETLDAAARRTAISALAAPHHRDRICAQAEPDPWQ